MRFPEAGKYLLRFSAWNETSSDHAEITIFGGASPEQEPNRDRVLWLKFDERDGTLAEESSSFGNHGTVSGGAEWEPEMGVHEGALRFNGSLR